MKKYILMVILAIYGLVALAVWLAWNDNDWFSFIVFAMAISGGNYFFLYYLPKKNTPLKGVK